MIDLLHDLVHLFSLAARELKLFLVHGYGRPDEEGRNVSGQSVVETCFREGLFDLGTDFLEVAVVVKVLHILVVRYVPAHCRVSGLADVIF